MLRAVATLLLLLTLCADLVAPLLMQMQDWKRSCANGCSGECCCSGANAAHSCAVTTTAVTGMQYANCAADQAAFFTAPFQSDRLLAAAAMPSTVFAAPLSFAAVHITFFEQFFLCPPDPPPRALAGISRTRSINQKLLASSSCEEIS